MQDGGNAKILNPPRYVYIGEKDTHWIRCKPTWARRRRGK